MRQDFDDLYEGPRFQYKARKRKKKVILTCVAAIIGIVIVLAAVNIFNGGKNEQANVVVDENGSSTENQNTGGKEAPPQKETSNDAVQNQPSTQSDEGSQDQPDAKEPQQQSPGNDENTSTEAGAGDDPLVIGTIHKNWDPIGTSQEGDHITQFDTDSQDWQEMKKAVSVATGVSSDDMIVWWMGNNGPNKVVSTVSTTDKEMYYRVYMEWIDGQGWKPNLVEQLSENDHKPEAASEENVEDSN